MLNYVLSMSRRPLRPSPGTEIITGTELTSHWECDSTHSKRANRKWLGVSLTKPEKWIRHTPRQNLKTLHTVKREKVRARGCVLFSLWNWNAFRDTLHLLMMWGLSFSRCPEKNSFIEQFLHSLYAVQVLRKVGWVRGKSQHFPVKN